MNIKAFFWDGDRCNGIIDSVERLHDVLDYYTIDELCNARQTIQLPGSCVGYLGYPSFGYRNEHVSKTRLEDWAKNKGLNLRAIAHRKQVWNKRTR
jgi:hypothetical protein